MKHFIQWPSYFDEKNKIELKNFFRIKHLFDDNRDFPEKITIEDFMETNIGKREYKNLTRTANDYKNLVRSAGITTTKSHR